MFIVKYLFIEKKMRKNKIKYQGKKGYKNLFIYLFN